VIKKNKNQHTSWKITVNPLNACMVTFHTSVKDK